MTVVTAYHVDDTVNVTHVTLRVSAVPLRQLQMVESKYESNRCMYSYMVIRVYK